MTHVYIYNFCTRPFYSGIPEVLFIVICKEKDDLVSHVMLNRPKNWPDVIAVFKVKAKPEAMAHYQSIKNERNETRSGYIPTAGAFYTPELND